MPSVAIGNGNNVTVRLEKVGAVRRNGEGGEVAILQDLSFLARSGEITTLIGPSGGGKSSLIRLINRLAEPSAGAVYLADTDIVQLDPLVLRRTVSLVPQKPFMFEGTVLENLQRPFLYRQQPLPGLDSDEVRHALELARLDQSLVGRDARSLSVGQQQRVCLARAIITKPKVLLLDEPTSALDRRTGDALAVVFREICRSQHLVVIMVTHDLRLAERISDHCIYLEAGRILEEGSVADLFRHPKTDELRRFLAEPSGEEV